MRSVLLAALALWANLTPAHAELGLDSVRNQLANHDFAALEQDFAEAHAKARDNGDSSLLRQVNGTLFFTVNDARLGQLRNWQAAYPASPYAATALAWSEYRRAFAQRGSGSYASVAEPALRAFERDLAAAARMGIRALETGWDYRPALDAAIVLSNHFDMGPSTEELVAHEQEMGPDYRSLYLGLRALSPYWGGSVEAMMALCEAHNTGMKNYNVEICRLQVLHMTNQTEPMLARLKATTAEQDAGEGRTNYLNSMLKYAYVNVREWQERPEALAELKRLLPDSLDCDSDFYVFQNDLYAIWSNFPDGNAIAADITRDYFRITLDCLKDNPQDPNLLASITSFAYGAEVPEPELSQARAMAEAAWQESLKLGAPLPDTWKAGRQIARNRMVEGAKGWWDYPTMERLYRNETAYSAYDLDRLHDYRMHLNFLREEGARLAPDSPEARLLARDGVTQDLLACRIWRVKRISDAICDQYWGPIHCNNIISSDLDREAAFLANGPLCPWERFAPVNALLEAPLPASEFVSASQ